MKTRCIFLLLLGWFSLPATILAQKDDLRITIENLPVRYSWSRDTVDSQGKPAGSSSGKEDELLTVTPDITENYLSFTRSGDTIFFTSTNSHAFVVYDNASRTIKKINYSSFISPVQTVTYAVEFTASSITVLDFDSVLVADLTGADILTNEISYSSDLRIGPVDGPGEYSEDNYISLGTSDPTTHIRISISKQHLLGVQKEHPQISALTIFPNPASSVVNVSQLGTTDASQVTITDMLGRTIGKYSANSTNDILQMDVSAIPPGIYWLRAGGEMRKFVIQR